MPVPDGPTALALDPCDLAAVKLLVGRAKDLALVKQLHSTGPIDAASVRCRIESLEMPIELTPHLSANFRHSLGDGEDSA